MDSIIESRPIANLEHAVASFQDAIPQFDDEALERALKTVSWNPRDLANYLRSNSAQ